MSRWLLVIVALAVAFSPMSRAETGRNETSAQHDARMKWWRDARFGMFIHWGIYSVPAGTWKGQRIENIGEWIMRDANIPVAEYAALASQFNPTQFNADEWVRLAKDAGMKYIVITSKHHDGFAMFHSKASDFNIYDATPFKRDPIKELAEACARHDMKLGFYYSQAQDWHHPGGAAMRRNPEKNVDDRNHWDPAQQGSFEQYIQTVAIPQVKEILTNYGPIAVLWWDTPQDMTEELARQFLPLLELQPGIITNNRLVHHVPEIQGDTDTPENYIPPTGFPGRDFEVCMTMNRTWGWKDYDNNWKSSQQLIRHLIDIASKGGNYLLNVGPTPQGLIPEPSVERLREMGSWMSINSESIYGTQASPFRKYSFEGRATRKDNKLYLHVFSCPEEGIKVTGLKSLVQQATWLDGGQPAKMTIKKENDKPVLVIAPPAKIDPIASVVVLEFAGPPEMEIPDDVLRASADGSIALPATRAILNARRAKIEPPTDYISHWTERRDALLWDFAANNPGMYQVEITYACADDAAGNAYVLNVGTSKLNAYVESTGGWESWNRKIVGSIEVSPGVQTLMIRTTRLVKGGLMNLKEVRLIPISGP